MNVCYRLPGMETGVEAAGFRMHSKEIVCAPMPVSRLTGVKQK